MHRRVRGKRAEDPDPPDEESVVEAPAPERIRTLFMGVPLKTKKGKEVLLQVQGLVNN